MLSSRRANHLRKATPSTPRVAVSLADVSVKRGRTTALRNVSFDVPTGSLTAVVGPNGAGKSSLFALLSGRVHQSAGDVAVAGPVAEVLQNTAVDEQLSLTVEEVVRLGRYPSLGLLGRMKSADRAAVHDAMAAVDLLELRRRPINRLSGGQRQRALVAQGLAQQAPVLLLDEPTTGLDLPSQELVTTVMRAEVERGATVFFATHNLHEAAMADNVIVLASECICCAPPVDAFADPAVTALFAPNPPLGASAPSPSPTEVGSADEGRFAARR